MLHRRFRQMRTKNPTELNEVEKILDGKGSILNLETDQKQVKKNQLPIFSQIVATYHKTRL